jgi:hypothetical protein
VVFQAKNVPERVPVSTSHNIPLCELLEQRIVEIYSRCIEKNSQRIKVIREGKRPSVSFWSNATHRRSNGLFISDSKMGHHPRKGLTAIITGLERRTARSNLAVYSYIKKGVVELELNDIMQYLSQIEELLKQLMIVMISIADVHKGFRSQRVQERISQPDRIGHAYRMST